MRAIESGKYKGKMLAECPPEYVVWAARHEENFAERNQWVSRDAKILLDRRAGEEAARQVAASKIARLEQLAAEGNFMAAMDLKMAKVIVGNKVTDISSKGNFGTKAFSLMR